MRHKNSSASNYNEPLCMAINGQMLDTTFVQHPPMAVFGLTQLQCPSSLDKHVLHLFITVKTVDDNSVACIGQLCISMREASLREVFLREGGPDELADRAVCLGRVFLAERGRGRTSSEVRRCRAAQHAAEPLIKHARTPSQSLCVNSPATSDLMWFLHRVHEASESSREDHSSRHLDSFLS